MKTQIIFLCVLGVIALVSCAPHQSYANQPETTPEEIMRVESQLPCVLNQGPCSELGLRIKMVLPEILTTRKCSTCTPEENAKVGRILYIMHEKFRHHLITLNNIYGKKQQSSNFHHSN
uniref:Chemosensory protein n=1 Tax=Cnaphalocrocis medinalis TaxID=437488 RepID=A0A0A1CR65_CNAME|nr:chemosensory protein [Cnaphalocrocis medinalis]